MSSGAPIQALRASNTRLTGPLPFLGEPMASMTHLELSTCNLQGTVPVSLGEFPFLQRINISNNAFSGRFSLSCWMVHVWSGFALVPRDHSFDRVPIFSKHSVLCCLLFLACGESTVSFEPDQLCPPSALSPPCNPPLSTLSFPPAPLPPMSLVPWPLSLPTWPPFPPPYTTTAHHEVHNVCLAGIDTSPT